MFSVCSKEWKISGQITVEIAILLPGIILWIVWLVFFMVFLVDMAVVKSESIRLADEVSMIFDKDGDLETGQFKLKEGKGLMEGIVRPGNRRNLQNKGKSRLAGRIRDRILLTSYKDTKLTVGTDSAASSGSVLFRWPFMSSEWIGISGMKFTGRAVAPVNNWEEFLRKAKAADIISGTRR